MGTNPPLFDPLPSATALAKAGVAVHWLHPKSKRPIGKDWAAKPVATAEMLASTYLPGVNVGIRLGEPSKIGDLFLHVIDLDIRKPESTFEALDRLRELLPEVDTLPFVISGSGGASRHFYFLSDQAFSSKKLAHSGVKFTDAAGKQHWTYEIELFGTGKQVAAPPSIHPDTGKPYVWGREIDFDVIDMGAGPEVASSRIAAWTGASGSDGSSLNLDDDEDLLTYTRTQPLGLSDDEVKAVLRDLPLADYCEDRDGWLQVGMALHHEFEGADKGLKFWNAFSKKSEKYNEADQARVWASFRGRPTPVRMASLVKAAGIARLDEEHEGDGFDEPASDDDEIADLLGDTPAGDQTIADLLGEAEPPGPDDTSPKKWRELLDLNDEGVLKPTLTNIALIIKNDPRTKAVAQHNEFTKETVQRGAPGRMVLKKQGPKPVRQLTGPVWNVVDRVNGDLWGDAHDNEVREVLEANKRQGGYGIKISDRDLRAAIDIAARSSGFHPVREYLDRVKWDGHSRVETLFVRYFGAPDNSYIRSVARLWMIAAVARVMKPGHKFDFAPILEGVQGKRKSTFISILAKNWFAELDGDFHDTKQMIEIMQGAWILEIPELTGFGKADVRVIKAFISRQRDKARLSYARRADVFPRQSVMMGSTNDRRYLKDDTGGRRFWPVECHLVGEIDTTRLELEVDQLWAEAMAMHAQMRVKQPHGDLPLYLTDKDAQTIASSLQESRRIETAENAMAGRIDQWLNAPIKDETGFDDEDDLLGGPAPTRNETCLLELWVECLGRDRGSYDNRAAQTLGIAMQQVEGWYSDGTQQRTRKYGKQRIYLRVD